MSNTPSPTAAPDAPVIQHGEQFLRELLSLRFRDGDQVMVITGGRAQFFKTVDAAVEAAGASKREKEQPK